MLTALYSYYAATTAKAKDQLRFESAVEQTQSKIENRLETYLALLQGSSGLFSTSTPVTKQEFQAYVERLDLRRRYPGVQGIGYSVRVLPIDVPTLVADLQSQGVTNFAIRPESLRSEYYPIVYLEPPDPQNQTAIGFDMFTESKQRTAMKQARDAGSPAASGRVMLTQEAAQKQAGFLVYVPLYRGGRVPETVIDRRNGLQGFVYSPFRARDLLQGVFGDEQQLLVNFQVYDGTEVRPDNLLHDTNQSDSSASFQTIRPLTVAGRTWTLVFSSRPELGVESERGQVPYILLGGVLASFVLFAIMRSQIRARLFAERASRDLQQTNDRLGLLYGMSSSLLLQEQPIVFINRLFSQLSNHLQLEVYLNYLIDADRQMLHLNAHRGIPEQTVAQLEWLELSDAICGVVASEQRPIVIENTQHSTDPCVEVVHSLGVAAYACYPLVSRGRLIGTFSFGTRDRSRFQPDELALMQVMCDQIATALERSRLLTDLQRQTEQLTQANRLKDEFLSVLSHELRTPLNSIIGWTRLLRFRTIDENTKDQALETLERNGQSLAQMVEDILEVSRIVTGKLRLELDEVLLPEIVEAAISTIYPAAIAKEIRVEREFDATITTILGDANRLQQVVWNLLSNAVKFTPKGGQITVRLMRTEAHIQVQVSDTGRGIHPKFLPYVFDRFRQADSSLTRAHGGLGLGLAIVRHLVELHGGTVEAESPGEGQGATFTLRFPTRQLD